MSMMPYYNLVEIKYRYIIDVCKCFAYKIPIGEYFIKLFNDSLSIELLHKNIVNDIKIIYDETIWPPNDKDAHGKIVRIVVKQRPTPDLVIFDIDLRKKISEPVTIISSY